MEPGYGRPRLGPGKDQDLDQELDNYLEDLEQWESDVMVANQIIITVLGSNIVKCLILNLDPHLLLKESKSHQISAIFGNLLTLVALPYIRYKYGSQFSILKLNSVILLLHLSLCDLLYGIIGFPHLIHTYLYMTNVYSDDVCYLLGMVRNLIAYTDFTNIAVISCCVARQTLCK